MWMRASPPPSSLTCPIFGTASPSAASPKSGGTRPPLRAAGSSPPFPLLIEPPLANKLTDDAFKQLMLYAGNALTSIYVIGAPSTFKFAGKRLPRTFLPNLRALTINYCEGVSIRYALLPFLQSAVASSSIDYIHLAGCDMEGMSMKDLTELKSFLRDPSDPTCFDLCRCDNPECHEITSSDESRKCMACDHVLCDECCDDYFEIECDECCAFVCCLGDCPGDDFVAEHVRSCEDCEQLIAMTARQCFSARATRPVKDARRGLAMNVAVFTNAMYAKEYGAMIVSVKIIIVERCGGSKKYREDKFSDLTNTRRDAANRCAKTA